MITTEPTATVFDIQRFSLHDGPGIRTTVFLKGCPLHCRWCHNPESQDPQPEIGFDAAKCIACGACVAVCPEGCHSLDSNGQHTFNRTRCTRCGACVGACCTGALEKIGRDMTVAEVMDTVRRDKPFYDSSGGGLTLSGGEPLARPAFSSALLAAAAAEGIHTAVETSGFGPPERYRAIAPLARLVLFDCKETDPARHLLFTGAPLDAILANLRLLDHLGTELILRCPLIPGTNLRDDHRDGIARLATELHHLREIHLIPYHPLGIAKQERIGRTPDCTEPAFTDRDVIQTWIEHLAPLTRLTVRCP